MSVEPKRGCGYRKIGNLYLVGDGPGFACDRLPFPLHTCPTCSAGIKQARGWTWIDPGPLFGGPHLNCNDSGGVLRCPICYDPAALGRTGLLWVGVQHYPTVAEFLIEAGALGISKRIKAVPRGFEVGKTWVLLAHPRAVRVVCAEENALLGVIPREERSEPGIFRVFRPTRVEKMVSEKQAGDAEFMADLARRGLTAVVLPEDDPDHAAAQEEMFEETA